MVPCLLLVEDNPDHADLILQLASRSAEPLDIVSVSRLADAREIVKERAFDAVLLDLQLPDCPIGETLNLALEHFPDIAIIVLTSLSESSIGEDAVRSGAQDFLVKNELTADTLLRSIKHSMERHRIDRERRMNAAELKRSNENLQRFAHAVAHEVKSPLQVVNSCISILRRRLANSVDDSTEDVLAETEEAVSRLRTLIDEMLMFSRVDGGKGDEFIDLKNAALEAVDNLSDLLRACGGRVELKLNLPQIKGRDRLFVHLFQNLISNAVRHRSEEPPHIVITGKDHGVDCSVSVADNGVGIEADELEKVFDLFYRGGSTNTEGSGVGLAFCRNVVELHGGSMWAESTPGQGATISFRIPKDTTD